MFKKLFLIIVILLAGAGQALAAPTTFYANKSCALGAGCDGTTADKGFTTLKAAIDAINAKGDGGGHTLYIKAGLYNGANDYIALTDADTATLTIIGDGAATTTIQSSADYANISGDGPDGVTISGLTLKPSGAKNAIITTAGTDTWTIYDVIAESNVAGAHTVGLMYFGGTDSLSMYRVKFIHNIADAADKTVLRLTGDTTGTLSYLVFEYPSIPTRNGIWGDGTGTTVIQNSIIGGGYYAILRQGTGTFNTFNNILFGVATVGSTYTATRTAGTFDIDTSIIMGTTAEPTYYVSAGVTTDSGTDALKGANPSILSYGKVGYVVPCVDDSANPSAAVSLAYVQALEALLSARGYHGTWFVEGANWNTDNNAALRTLVTNGTMEVASHSWSHSDLAVADALKIWDTSANVTISRAADTITTAGGTVEGFKAKTLAAIKTELEAAPHSLTVTKVDAAYESNAPGAIDATAKGEVLKDSGPGTTVTVLVTDETAGLFKAEMVTPKAWLADTIINGAGNVTDPQTAATYVVNSFGSPYNTRSALSIAAAKAAGFTSGRNYGYQTHASTNLYTLHTYNSSKIIGATTALTKANMRSILANAAYYGQVVYILGHKEAEISTTEENGWQAILDTIAEFGPAIQVKSGQEVAAILRASPWTYAAATGISTRTYTTYGTYKLRTNSPALNAGTDICASYTGTDYYGKTVCTGGNYMGRLSTEIGIADFPTVGQGAGGSLNLLWLGK